MTARCESDGEPSDVSDYPGGFVLVKSVFGRMHLFASEGKDEIIKKIQENIDDQLEINTTSFILPNNFSIGMLRSWWKIGFLM